MEWSAFIIQFITALGVALPPTIMALVALLKVLAKMRELHKAINGRMDELLDAKAAESVAIGRKQVRAEIAQEILTK